MPEFKEAVHRRDNVMSELREHLNRLLDDQRLGAAGYDVRSYLRENPLGV